MNRAFIASFLALAISTIGGIAFANSEGFTTADEKSFRNHLKLNCQDTGTTWPDCRFVHQAFRSTVKIQIRLRKYRNRSAAKTDQDIRLKPCPHVKHCPVISNGHGVFISPKAIYTALHVVVPTITACKDDRSENCFEEKYREEDFDCYELLVFASNDDNNLLNRRLRIKAPFSLNECSAPKTLEATETPQTFSVSETTKEDIGSFFTDSSARAAGIFDTCFNSWHLCFKEGNSAPRLDDDFIIFSVSDAKEVRQDINTFMEVEDTPSPSVEATHFVDLAPTIASVRYDVDRFYVVSSRLNTENVDYDGADPALQSIRMNRRDSSSNFRIAGDDNDNLSAFRGGVSGSPLFVTKYQDGRPYLSVYGIVVRCRKRDDTCDQAKVAQISLAEEAARSLRPPPRAFSFAALSAERTASRYGRSWFFAPPFQENETPIQEDAYWDCRNSDFPDKQPVNVIYRQLLARISFENAPKTFEEIQNSNDEKVFVHCVGNFFGYSGLLRDFLTERIAAFQQAENFPKLPEDENHIEPATDRALPLNFDVETLPPQLKHPLSHPYIELYRTAFLEHQEAGRDPLRSIKFENEKTRARLGDSLVVLTFDILSQELSSILEGREHAPSHPFLLDLAKNQILAENTLASERLRRHDLAAAPLPVLQSDRRRFENRLAALRQFKLFQTQKDQTLAIMEIEDHLERIEKHLQKIEKR